MIAEKRKLFFSFLSYLNLESTLLCKSNTCAGNCWFIIFKSTVCCFKPLQVL